MGVCYLPYGRGDSETICVRRKPAVPPMQRANTAAHNSRERSGCANGTGRTRFGRAGSTYDGGTAGTYCVYPQSAREPRHSDDGGFLEIGPFRDVRKRL